MRVLVLHRFDRTGASSRLRTMQYFPHLRACGHELHSHSLFDARYLLSRYQSKRGWVDAARCLAGRIRTLLRKTQADVIWLEQEATPWLPWCIEKRLLPAGTPFCTDYDDAIFHRYEHHPRWLIRNLLGTKIDAIMANSAHVVAGNRYLKARADQSGARKVTIIPTVVDTDRYTPRSHTASDRASPTPTIGWIGSPTTWELHGAPHLENLRTTIRSKSARFVTIGASHSRTPYTDAQGTLFLPWSEETEVQTIQSLDVGIMPLPDDAWSRGKCGYKIIQYMACSVAVIASPVGANCDIVQSGQNGILVNSPSDWQEAVSSLLSNHDLRAKLAARGRQTVVKSYSLRSQKHHLDRILRESATG